MSARLAIVAIVFALAGTNVWLFHDNRRLRAELSDRDGSAPSDGEPSAAADSFGEPAASSPRSPRAGLGGLLSRLGRGGGGERPRLDAADSGETRGERRLRRSREMRAFLGRDDGETVEQYRARMVPLVESGLATPRARLEQTRRELEDRANVSDEQRVQLQQVVDDVAREALDLTNRAIADRDLTPYDRNWSGALSYAGGLGAILDGAERRLGSVLSADQREVFRSSGFEWGEYLGAHTPWEHLDPPPPPPAPAGSDR